MSWLKIFEALPEEDVVLLLRVVVLVTHGPVVRDSVCEDLKDKTDFIPDVLRNFQTSHLCKWFGFCMVTVQ